MVPKNRCEAEQVPSFPASLLIRSVAPIFGPVLLLVMGFFTLLLPCLALAGFVGSQLSLPHFSAFGTERARW